MRICLKRSIVVLLATLAACYRSKVPGLPADAIPSEGIVCITPSRAELAFSLMESVIPPGTKHFVVDAMWLGAGGRVDRVNADALRTDARSREGEFLTTDALRGRPLRLTVSAGGEPPGSATLRDSVGFLTMRAGHIVFIVEGAAAVASVFATAPDSVLMAADFRQVRALPVRRASDPSRCVP